MTSFGRYSDLLKTFLERGYEVSGFTEDPTEYNSLLLRHDIDFDVGYAHEMSLIEDVLGVKSTYFFLLRSHSYNFLDPDNLDLVKSMHERGHTVSLHFDPTLYSDIEEGFDEERKLFEAVVPTEVGCVSIHRPSDYFLGNPEQICGITHTYHPRLFEQTKYFADSAGRFRYGHPAESAEFAEGKSLQLLIHPIWWKAERDDEPVEKLTHFLSERMDRFEQHMAANCRPYRAVLESRSS